MFKTNKGGDKDVDCTSCRYIILYIVNHINTYEIYFYMGIVFKSREP